MQNVGLATGIGSGRQCCGTVPSTNKIQHLLQVKSITTELQESQLVSNAELTDYRKGRTTYTSEVTEVFL